ncbi:hypothetical protein OROHE_008663 [Orobanche hederae]
MIGASSNELSTLIEYNMRKLAAKDSTSCGACGYNPTVSVALKLGSDCFHSDSDFRWKCGSLNEVSKYGDLGGYDDEWFDDYLKSLLDDNGSSNNGGKVYTVIVVRREKRKENVSIVFGKYRHVWIVGRVSEEEAVRKVAEMFVKAFVNGGKEEGSITGEFMPVGADGRIVLSFNLLNADPRDWIYDWDFQEIDDNLLAPITEALKPLADISVESQVLYHTPKSSFSYWDDKLGTYIFTTKDLPFFVNSNEWHLDTSVAAGGRSKILHFVVYVPSARECPLLLQLPSGEISTTNGFISPMWGSVVVWNPSACFEDSEMETHVRNKISPEDLERIFEVFIGQLRQLFGLKSKGLFADASDTLRLLTSDKGFTEFVECQWHTYIMDEQNSRSILIAIKICTFFFIYASTQMYSGVWKHPNELANPFQVLIVARLLIPIAVLLSASSVVLLICVTKVAKSAFDKALAEHEDIYDVVGSEEPIECDHGVDLQQPLLIKIDSSNSHKK